MHRSIAKGSDPRKLHKKVPILEIREKLHSKYIMIDNGYVKTNKLIQN